MSDQRGHDERTARFEAVFRGELPDRAPVTLFIQDQGHFINQLHPQIDPWDSLSLQLKTIEVQRELGADIMARLLFGTLGEFQWMLLGGLDVSRSTARVAGRDDASGVDGRTTIRTSVIETPDGQLSQEYSIDEIRPGTLMYACTRKPVNGRDELELVAAYEPGMAADYPARVAEMVAPIAEAVGDDGWVGLWAPHGPFNMASLLVTEDVLYSLFYEDPRTIVASWRSRWRGCTTTPGRSMRRAWTSSSSAATCPAASSAAPTTSGTCSSGRLATSPGLRQRGTPASYHNCGQIQTLGGGLQGPRRRGRGAVLAAAQAR